MANSVEKELLELERRYWQALKDKDVEAAMRMTDDPCIVTGAQGVSGFDGTNGVTGDEQLALRTG